MAVAETLGSALLEDEVIAGTKLFVGVLGLGCKSLVLTEDSIGPGKGDTMLVTGCFLGASSTLTLTAVFILLTTIGDVCEATFA